MQACKALIALIENDFTEPAFHVDFPRGLVSLQLNELSSSDAQFAEREKLSEYDMVSSFTNLFKEKATSHTEDRDLMKLTSL